MPVDPTRLRDVLDRAIAGAAEVDPAEIDDDMNLFDLGLDSLDLATILLEIEDELDAEIPAEMLDRFLDVGGDVTIADVVHALSTWDPAGPDRRDPYGEVVVFEQR